MDIGESRTITTVGKSHESLVRDFMRKNNQAFVNEPTADIPDHVKVLRLRLIAEEFGELAAAIHEGNLVLIADALADLEYVVVGTAIAYGIPHEEVFQEVHRSNMTKPSLNEHNKGGKVLKEGYQKADIDRILYRPLFAPLPDPPPVEVPPSRQKLCAEPGCPMLHEQFGIYCHAHKVLRLTTRHDT